MAHKVAVVVLADGEAHESLGRLVNGLVTAREFKEAGDEVTLVFDGGGTHGLARVAREDDKAHGLFQAVRDEIAGACSFCASAFGVEHELRALDIPLLDEYAKHPSLRGLVDQGYRILTF